MDYSDTIDKKTQKIEPSDFFENIKRQIFACDYNIEETDFKDEISFIEEMNNRYFRKGFHFYIGLIKNLKKDLGRIKSSTNITNVLNHCRNKAHEIEMNTCDCFIDKLDGKYEKKGEAVLIRNFIHLEYDESEGEFGEPRFITTGEEKRRGTVARGITAYLAYEEATTAMPPSLRVLRQKGDPCQDHEIFETYFGHCLKFLREVESKRTPFKTEQKTDIELIRQHYEDELKLLAEPQLIYEYIENDPEKWIIEEIRKGADYYIDWLKKKFFYIEDKGKISLDVIALKFIFEEIPITQKNKNEIAKQNGYNSGDALYNHYCKFARVMDRIADLGSKTKLKNRIELYENVIKILPESKKQRAISELGKLYKINEQVYHQIN